MMLKSTRFVLLGAALLLGSAILISPMQASDEPPASSPAPAAAANTAPAAQASLPPGDKPVENSEEEENSQFKYSPIVMGIARKTGLSKQAVFWSFLVANFAILAGFAMWVVRKAMPQGYAPRKAEIRKALDEARRASAEAGARLSEIEGRLGRMDAEIAEIRAAAETDFSGEEQRIKADAEQDAKTVIASAELEIAAASRAAQRELKAFAAGLAVDLAEKKIKVDAPTDEALIRGFASRLGKDGQS